MSEYYWAYDIYGNHRIAKEFSGKPSLILFDKVVPVDEASGYLGDRIIAPSDNSSFKKLDRSTFPDGYFWISFYEPTEANQRFYILLGRRGTWELFDAWSMTPILPIDYVSILVGPRIEVPPYNREKVKQ